MSAAFDMDDERLARMAWSALCEPGDVQAQRLVDEIGPVPALRRVCRGEGEPRWQVRRDALDPVGDLAKVVGAGGRLLIPGDPEWPPGMLALGMEAPFCLYVRGPLDLSAAGLRCAAIVGARAATPYGEHVAADLAAGCALRDVTVVSGAAYGIDGAAHRGALAAGGATIAVLACGIDRVYPRGHEKLINAIAAEGAVVTEIPPGRTPTRWRFVERNRLIAALARVTVVVEAGHRSGARGTAMRAMKIGAPVAVVPGPVTSAASYGCHRLLRDEAAICVTNADEVAELACPMGEHFAEPPAMPPGEFDDLDAIERRVLDALPTRSTSPLPTIVQAAGLVASDVMGALDRLEACGFATRTPSGWHRS